MPRHSILFLFLLTGAIAAARDASAQDKGLFTLKAAHSNLCVDVEGDSKENRARIIQYTCNGKTNQQWRLQQIGDIHHITSVSSGKCLDIRGRNIYRAGAGIVQNRCDDEARQDWILKPTGVDNQFTVQSAPSNFCLDVGGSSLESYAPIVQWYCNGGKNQTFIIEPVGATPTRPVKPTEPVDPKPPVVAEPTGAGKYGEWGEKMKFSLVPVSASLLGNGKVMLWSGSGKRTFGGGKQTYSMVFDPTTGKSTSTLLTSPAREYFCEGTAQLADGSVVVTGGSNPSTSTILSPSGEFTAGPNMKTARGYAGQVLTSAGKVFTIGGSWSGGVANKKGEVYTPNGDWQTLSGTSPEDLNTNDPAGQYRADNHMWLIAAANGYVLHAGPAKRMHWINTSGDGAITSAGQRGSADAMNGNAVVYDIGKVLTMGGAPSYSEATPTNAAYTIDFSAGPGSTPIVEKTDSMKHARTFANSVVLPNGQVVVIGGNSRNASPFADNDSVLEAEIWTPETGRFTTLAAMATPRNYHSIAILLPDARILAAGGGLCGCSADHPDGEIFSPPYLFNPDGSPAKRPELWSVPAAAKRGSAIVVSSKDAVSYALVRASSTTHSVNNDQRRVPLRISGETSNGAKLHIPGKSGVLIPGNYMLFAMSASGTPSVASIINIY